MLGDIIYSCIGVANQICGDPIGAWVHASNEVDRRKRFERRMEPEVRLATRKLDLYNSMMEWENKLNEQLASKYPHQPLIELYTKYRDEYKEKLQLLK